MKKLAVLCAAAAMTLAGPAFAQSFSPSGATVTATGATSLTAPGFPTLNCAATFRGTVNSDGTATISPGGCTVTAHLTVSGITII